MNYIAYNTETGEILRTGQCPGPVTITAYDENKMPYEKLINEGQHSQQARSGESVIEGIANDEKQYIKDGIVTDYTADQLIAKSSVPYGYEWDIKIMSAVKKLSDDEIVRYLATQARSTRDKLLSDCEWTQANDQVPETKKKWVPYRQALRDLPAQSGFPLEIVWPEKPE